MASRSPWVVQRRDTVNRNVVVKLSLTKSWLRRALEQVPHGLGLHLIGDDAGSQLAAASGLKRSLRDVVLLREPFLSNHEHVTRRSAAPASGEVLQRHVQLACDALRFCAGKLNVRRSHDIATGPVAGHDEADELPLLVAERL